jgi:hypothetical protein
MWRRVKGWLPSAAGWADAPLSRTNVQAERTDEIADVLDRRHQAARRAGGVPQLATR